MSTFNCKYLVCDFETTVYAGQTFTEVWASAVVEMNTEDVMIFHSIDDTMEYFSALNCNIIAYFHNLKFDGSFWLSYFLVKRGFKQACEEVRDENGVLKAVTWHENKDMQNGTFKYSISDMGQWYKLTYKLNGHIIEIRDSLKLLPFSVKRIGESFGTKHKKLDMEYEGFRYAGCEITKEEKEYIANDVLVVKEALEIMFSQGHKKLTIGSCCLSEFKHEIRYSPSFTKYDYMFPNLYEVEFPFHADIPQLSEKGESVGEWIRQSYKGGWCYLVRGKECKEYYNGTTADVNSLYPSMMSSMSGNRYPIGLPEFFTGDPFTGDIKTRLPDFNEDGVPLGWWGYEKRYTPDNVPPIPFVYYFIRIKTAFQLKPGKLPCIQIKGNPLYDPTAWLESSDFYLHSRKLKSKKIRMPDGQIIDNRVVLTLTMTDYKLIKEHYDLIDCEILGGVYFSTLDAGEIFDGYIGKYKRLKMNSKGALRELAKLFLNNLYGKMAASTDSCFKHAVVKDGVVKFELVEEHSKIPGYIPIGSAITSYARNFTIRAAQANYHGVDKPGFIYADTDSIHCDLPPDQIVGIKADKSEFCCWKLETCWDTAWFVRQKTYIEHVTHEDCTPCNPYYNVKCAGLPENCKNLFVKSLEHYEIKETDKYTPEEAAVINARYSLKDFNVGLALPGKLKPHQIRGGVVLIPEEYKMR